MQRIIPLGACIPSDFHGPSPRHHIEHVLNCAFLNQPYITSRRSSCYHLFVITAVADLVFVTMPAVRNERTARFEFCTDDQLGVCRVLVAINMRPQFALLGDCQRAA